MKRFTMDEMINMTSEEFAENWTAIACSAYEDLGGQLDIDWDNEDNTEED